MKILICLFILTFPISLFANEKAYVNAVNDLVLCEGTGTDKKKIITIDFNSEVIIKKYDNEKVKIENISASWAEIKYKGLSVLVFSGFLNDKKIDELGKFRKKIEKNKNK